MSEQTAQLLADRHAREETLAHEMGMPLPAWLDRRLEAFTDEMNQAEYDAFLAASKGITDTQTLVDMAMGYV